MIEPDIFIEENSPRDGIQNESTPFSLEERVELIDTLSSCGFKRIQIGSFVNPRMVPQMADTEKVYERIVHCSEVSYSALVLNERGLERALSCGIEHISIFVSASETHSRRNTNCSVDAAALQAKMLIDRARNRGIRVQAGVMNAFGCRFEGCVPPERVLKMIDLFMESGAEEINLADTAGVANPEQIEQIIARVRNTSDFPLALHLHDTYGFGLANVHAAWKAGVRRFDASCGGLGGCPFIPGAAGNIATEDVVHFFEMIGVATGIDLQRLVGLIHKLEGKLGRPLPGRYAHINGGASHFFD